MPSKTYTLRFTHTDGFEIEEFEHTNEAEARAHFELFGIEDGDIYSRIDLVETDWNTHTERLMDSRLLNSPA